MKKEEYKHICPYSIACSHNGTEECMEDHIECRYFQIFANSRLNGAEEFSGEEGLVHIIESQ